MSQRPRRNPVPRLCAALLALGLALLPARAAFTRAPEDTTYTTYTYLPTITTTGRTYVPLVQRSGAPPNPAGTPINIIANPSFENQAWFTDGFGNQHPAGWQFYAPAQGQTMPFSTKRDNGGNSPAISGGLGEYVHKYYWQLPDNERLGGVRGLILAGQLVYKVFSDHIPHALRLSQVITHTPGQWVRVTGYIVGEANINWCSGGTGLLEDDTFLASVQLGSAADTRFYSVMRTHYDVLNNTRPWNKFSVTAQAPGNGQLLLAVIAQSNWACPVDFFVEHFEAFEVAGP